MILLEKEKIKYYEFYEHDCLDKFTDVTDKSGLMKSLTDKVVFAKDFTFRDFFNHLLREKKDLNKTFLSTMRGYEIDDYIIDMNIPKKQKKDTEIASVQVDWRIEVKKNELEIISGFHGVGRDGNGNRENAVETVYGMSMTPLYYYADFPFRLNENFIIEDYRKKTVKKVLKNKKPFTLFEVLHAVLYEITWDGKPKERDKRLRKLKKRIKQSGKDIAAGNYKTLEEVKKELEARFSEKGDK
jgi:hypothetical protein